MASRARLLAVLLVGVLAATLLSGCRAAEKESVTTGVTRTKVTRVTGTAADTPEETVERSLPGDNTCKHVWRAADRETHMYVDATYDLPMTALCTPIRCDKCGATRHECLRRMRR
jgi:hypothetical protein